jgi:hypothetical protein
MQLLVILRLVICSYNLSNECPIDREIPENDKNHKEEYQNDAFLEFIM